MTALIGPSAAGLARERGTSSVEIGHALFQYGRTNGQLHELVGHPDSDGYPYLDGRPEVAAVGR